MAMHGKITQLGRWRQAWPLVWLILVMPSAVLAQGDTVPAQAAADWSLTPFGELRLRQEYAEDAALPRAGSALTLRARAGAELGWRDRVQVLGEIEAVAQLAGTYFNGFGPPDGRPLIADGEVLEINRLQLEMTLVPGASVTIGRQDLAMDDERFLGAINFRQDMQTYDAVRASVLPADGVVADVGYFRQVNRPFADGSSIGSYRGGSWFIRASVPTPIGQISGFHYAFAIADPGGRDAGSSMTSGIRVDGKAYRGETGLLWEASLARQHDYGANPAEFAVSYAMANLALDTRVMRIDLRAEILDSDTVTAFQTPLGTNHKFQGAADVFLVTPPDGVEDYSLRLLARLGSINGLRAITLAVAGHVFGAAASSRDYGREVDVSLGVGVLGMRASMEYARYFSTGFAQDQSRLWLTLARAF